MEINWNFETPTVEKQLIPQLKQKDQKNAENPLKAATTQAMSLQSMQAEPGSAAADWLLGLTQSHPLSLSLSLSLLLLHLLYILPFYYSPFPVLFSPLFAPSPPCIRRD